MSATAESVEAAEELLRRGREKRLLFDAPGYQEAVPLLREAIELCPAGAPAYAEISQTYAYWGFRREISGQEHQSLYDMAYEYAETALRLAPGLGAAHRAMSVALRRGRRADPERRRREILAALELGPDDPESLCELWRVEGYDPGHPALRRALELAPRLAALHIDLGAVLCELGRLDEALAELQKALDVNPVNAQVYYDIAMVLQRKGLREKALEILRRALRLAPGDPLLAQGIALLEAP